jgi:hypothetical protein
MSRNTFESIENFSFRRDERYALDVPGKYCISVGRVFEALLLDVSEYGCRLRAGNLAPNAVISIWAGAVGPIGATVKWRDHQFTGIAFDKPLDTAVLQEMLAQRSVRSERVALSNASRVIRPV